jgi:hypothetical protein
MVVLATALGHSIANTDWKTLLLVEDPGELPRTVAVVAVAVAVAGPTTFTGALSATFFRVVVLLAIPLIAIAV